MTDWQLDQPILWLSSQDSLTPRDLMEGVLGMGATGSGKSSGPARMLLKSMLRAGFGGLALTTKPNDAADIIECAREVGRDGYLIIVSPKNLWRCNVFGYECCRSGTGAGLTENIAQLLLTLIELGERSQGSGQNEQYWQRATGQLIRNAIEVCKGASGTVSIADLHELVRTAPQSGADVESETWRESSFLFQSILKGENRQLGESQRKDFEHAAKYFFSEWPYLAEKTRSVIVSSFTSVTDAFQRSVLRELFCTSTNFVPELCFLRGAVIVLDLPVKDEYGEVGRFAQVLFKEIFQRAMQRRSIAQNGRPVFLYVDEFQEFVGQSDRSFQALCRSARVCCVYMTQNLPTVYAALGGGDAAKQATDSLLGNLNTKIFMANGDPVTNQWAADTFSKTWQYRTQIGCGSAPAREAFALRSNLEDRSANASVSEQLDYVVQPAEFSQLKRGGPPDFLVEGIVFQGGRRWALTDSTAMNVLFSQRG